MRASVKTLVAAVLATVASCSSERQSVPSTLVYAGERGPAVQVTDGLLLTRDGIVVYQGQKGVILPVPASRSVRLLDAITNNSELFSRWGDGPPTRLAVGVRRFLGVWLVEREDGSVFDGFFNGTSTAFPELPQLRGVTACTRAVCILNGAVIDISAILERTSDTPRFLDFPDIALDIGWGLIQPSTLVLAPEGRVYASDNESGASLTFHRVEGIPPIRQLHTGFMQDWEGRIWYVGPVAHEGLPTVLLPDSAHRYRCDRVLPKGRYDCVEPVELPALRNTAPYTFGGPVYAIMPDGTVRCWSDDSSGCSQTWRL